MLDIGTKAPAFSLPDQNGAQRSLEDFQGKWLLVYFYPKDATPGCTTEAQELRDQYEQFTAYNAEIVGVSTDSVESHKKFAEKQNLPFTLLADTEKEMVAAYGVYGPKQFMGKSYEGVSRSSYLISPDGNIAKVYEKVKPKEHPAEVLGDLAELTESA